MGVGQPGLLIGGGYAWKLVYSFGIGWGVGSYMCSDWVGLWGFLEVSTRASNWVTLTLATPPE